MVRIRNIFGKNFHSKALFWVSIVFVPNFFLGCLPSSAEKNQNQIRVLIDSIPATLDPRQTLDAIGQRLEMFAFHALTSLDTNLDPEADLSEKWRFENGGDRVVFTVRSDLKDHQNVPITPARILRCMRNYFFSEPKSLHASSFPTVRDITLEKGEIVFQLNSPDPYLPRNISVLRYFTIAGDPDDPCRAIKPGETIVTNGYYSVNPYPARFERALRFSARDPGAPDLVFEFVREETSRLFKLLNGEGDLVMNSFSPTKTEWITEPGKHGFNLVEHDGANASYLAFNLGDPILHMKKVREAIAHAIDRKTIVTYKLRNQATLTSSFLSPILPESIPVQPFLFDPQMSERLLDEAGFPRRSDGMRFKIKYKTTTSREGLELAQVFREMLGKIGINLELEPVEPSVFFASIRKGKYQMYMSRWVGVADGSIFYRSLRSGTKENRVGYVDPIMDDWLDRSLREMDFSKRKKLLVKIQERMLEELPYFPLWHWTNALVLKDTIAPPKPDELSLSGSYFPLRKLRFKVKP